MNYYKLENNALIKMKSVERINGVWVSNPTAEQYASIGAYPRSEESFTPPICDDGYHAVADGYKVQDGKWVKVWKMEATTYTEADYDVAMEDYLRFVREGRGYTTREPSDYINSANPRWSQDAKDWVAFRDEVMTYALNVINDYAKTGNAPTLAEFKAGFPRIEWTYQEEA